MSDPFTPTPFYHYVLAWQLISNPNLKVLDYGSGRGEFIGEVGKLTKFAYGYEVDPEKIRTARKKYPMVTYKLGQVNKPLPYPDESFDIVTMFHVFEHVDSEIRVVREVYRVLKKGGIFILASPYQGLFTWADAANFRYRFPKLHRRVVEILLGRQEYLKRFLHQKLRGMYGDCTRTRKWHKHYTESELRHLLEDNFTIKRLYKFSLFYPFLLIPYNIINYLFKPKFNPVLWLIHLDNQIRSGNWSYNFVLIASKK